LDAFIARVDERDKRLDERDKRLDERDKRLDMLVQRATAAAESASNLKTHLWLAASTLMVAVIGTVLASYYATQASHLGMAQTVISAFQQGQQTQMQVPLRE
jgi:F0F1-type ATP synthase assembly protein I